MTPAIIYCRVSTDRQESDGTSLDTQEAACRAYARDRGYDVVDVIPEAASGSSRFNRPRLDRARAMLTNGQADVLICYDLDRISRNQIDVSVLYDEFAGAGARIELVTEDFETSATGVFMRSARAFAAQLEREKILERTMRGKRARVEGAKGHPGKPLPGRTPPYGYQWGDLEKSRLIENPDTAPIVRRIFDDAARGESVRAVTRRLNADGIPSPHGGTRWSDRTVGYLLRQRVYIGDLRAYRTQTTKHRGKKRQTVLPLDAHVPLPEGTAPALVDPATFQTAHEQLARHREVNSRKTSREEEALLRGGYLRCGDCGGPMVTINHHKKVVYTCSRRFRKLTTCRPITARAELLDPQIWDRVAYVLNDSAQIKVEWERTRPQIDPAIKTLDKGIAAHEKAIANLRKGIASADDDGTVTLLTDDLKSRLHARQSLQAERDALVAAHEVDARDFLDGLETFTRGAYLSATESNGLDYGEDADNVGKRVLAALDASWKRHQSLRGDVSSYSYEDKRAVLAWLKVEVTLNRTLKRERPLSITDDYVFDFPTTPEGWAELHGFTITARVPLDAPLPGPYPQIGPMPRRSARQW